MLTNISCVTDCHGQAEARLETRLHELFPEARVKEYLCGRDSIESSGNMLDALCAGTIYARLPRFTPAPYNRALLCNSAWRGEEGGCASNGGAIVYGEINGVTLVSTVGPLNIINRQFPNALKLRRVITDRIMTALGLENTRLSFRGLDLFTYILHLTSTMEGRVILQNHSDPFDTKRISAEVKSAVWCVDQIGKRPCNLKLTLRPQDLDGFGPGKKARINLAGREEVLPCVARLADLSPGELGLYVGSSWNNQGLEIARLDGNAADHFEIYEAGAPITITLLP